jgi:photosystem II stability/assembly factor-like uncharacterized protein
MKRQGLSRRTVLASGAAGALAGPGYAQAPAGYRWSNVKVGGGGFVPGIVFSPVEKGLAYLRSDMGGLYRRDERQGRWLPLQDAMPESNYQGVESVAPDPVDPEVVYAAVGMYQRDPAAILRSRDRGATWDVVPVPFRMGGNEDGRGVGERLAVDPNDTAVLYFASRHDGLQRSVDHGRTWAKVESFPLPGRGPPAGRGTHTGLSFVVFDPASAGKGTPSRRLFVGSADPGEGGHLFLSEDGGATWRAVEGEPRPDLLPVKAQIDGRGVLYLAYSNGAGPNGVTDGAVFRFESRTGAWRDITPEKGPGQVAGGYMGLSLDRSQPGALVVATLNRWRPGDVLWRTTDDGDTWRNIRDVSERDVSSTPFLLWGEPEADFGWWMAALAIDPFDPRTVVYATGATIYRTQAIAAERVLWRPWVEGVEQTAVLALTSPPAGPHPLISAFGDIGGFAHADLTRSPPMSANPIFTNTNAVDFAGAAPNVVVRSGTPHDGGPTLAWSRDYGRSWAPLAPPLPPGALEITVQGRVSQPYSDAPLAVSADGAVLMVLHPTPLRSTDGGHSWTPVEGLPQGLRPVADRVDGRRFHALDFVSGAVWLSTDAGASFVRQPTRGLPADLAPDQPVWREGAWPLMASPAGAGELWFVSRAGLFRSRDGGGTFVRLSSSIEVEALAFGKAAPGASHPALFAIGRQGPLRAIWRSDDAAKRWIRINDRAHEYGRRFRCLAGDPRVFGRVYVGTDGRGILMGEPAT